jgi:hypothetical protein
MSVLLGTLLGLTSVAVFAAPAMAEDVSTKIAFDGPTSLTVAFGTDWVLPISVAAPSAFRVLDSEDGTVDVTVVGLAGTFGRHLALYRGGHAYLAQPSAAPLLGIGKHTMNAVFQPAAGSGLDSSQTVKSFSLTVTGFAITTKSQVVDDPATVTTPVVRVSLDDAAYAKAFGGPPAGEWKITVTSDAGSPVFESSFAQPVKSTDPIDVAISPHLRSGRSYTVTADFVPDATVAQGLTLTTAPPIKYVTPPDDPFQTMVNAIPVPPWAEALGGAVLLLLLAAVIALSVQVRRRRSAAVGPAEFDQP